MTHPFTGLIALQSAPQSSPGSSPEHIGASAQIAEAVRSMLAEAQPGNAASITVAVDNGVVTLDGVVSDGLWLARFKNKITSAIPSVTIEDRVDWVVPDCGIGYA